ncbi:AAA family ATPase [Lysobacter sp. N42]|uniref:AAA family ATPase n=2 Tax=Gammaproteobacteria TaxID=1236 RepID=UPI0014049438|nr:AAA family ATPase [Lysobacter sp. N42]
MRHGLTGSGGFLLLTGEVGLGKTTISRAVFAELEEQLQINSILNPRLGELEMLMAIAEGFNIPLDNDPKSVKSITDAIANFLQESAHNGKHPVVVIDEAQHLLPTVLEQLRLLTNLETDSRKLLSVVLIGQPELKELLQRPDLRQVAQRVVARYQLMPFSEREVNAYIDHRLSTVGGSPALFTKSARHRIFKLTQGTPRLINLLCDRALQVACGKSKGQVDKKCIEEATDVLPSELASSHSLGWPVLTVILTVALVFTLSFVYWAFSQEEKEADVVIEPQVQSNELRVMGADLNNALQGLLQVWQLEDEVVGANLCESLVSVYVYCLQAELTLAEIKALDYPVIAKTQGEQNYVLIVRAEGQNWRIVDEEGEKTVPQAQLQSLFTGEVLAFYHVPDLNANNDDWRSWVEQSSASLIPFSIQSASIEVKREWLQTRLIQKTDDDSWLLALMSSKSSDIARPSLNRDLVFAPTALLLQDSSTGSEDSQARVLFPSSELGLRDIVIPEQQLNWPEAVSVAQPSTEREIGESEQGRRVTAEQVDEVASEDISEALQLLFEDAVRSTPPVESDYREVAEEQTERAVEPETRLVNQDADTLPNLNQVPTSIRSSMPQMSYDAHVYHSFARERFIELNQQRMREGDAMNGIRVVSIQPSYSIVEFNGLMFRLEALENINLR